MDEEELGDLLYKGWCLMCADVVNIIAIDPGLRKCGMARMYTSETMGLCFTFAVEEPMAYTYPGSKCQSVHASNVSRLAASMETRVVVVGR